MVPCGSSDHPEQEGDEQLPRTAHAGHRLIQNGVVSDGPDSESNGRSEARPLKGTVEFDSTWHGGVRKGGGRGNVTNKTSVMGAIERGGPIRLKVEKRTVSRKNIDMFFKQYVDPKTDNIFTDADPVYRAVDFGEAIHSAVDHSAKEWVRGEVHTNSIESVWSLFKRSVIGSYHHLSEKHLQSYLDEMSFRFNKRHDS